MVDGVGIRRRSRSVTLFSEPSTPPKSCEMRNANQLLNSETLPPDGPSSYEHINRPSLPRPSSIAPMATSTLISPVSTMYAGPPPPYSFPPSTLGGVSSISGLISPPESRRRSDDKEVQQNTNRQSLPSLHEALSAKPSTYPAPTPVTLPPPQSFSHMQPPTALPPRLQAVDIVPYPERTRHAPPQQNVPPEPVHPQQRSYSRSEAGPASMPIAYEPPRHSSYSAPRPPQSPPRTSFSSYSTNDSSRYETHRPPASSGYPEAPSPYATQHGSYPAGPASAHGHPASAYSSSAAHQPQRPFPSARYGLEHAEEHSKFGEPATMRKAYGPVLKRHLDNFDLENSLADVRMQRWRRDCRSC